MHEELYNLLMDVEPADELLMTLNKLQILHDLSAVIRRYRLENLVGIRLLHRHHTLSLGELMLEATLPDRTGQPTLTTSAVHRTEVTRVFAPNSWMVFNGELYPMEYSVDAAVTSAADISVCYADFFREFVGTLAEAGATGLLGPCILRRAFIDIHQPAGNPALVESTDEELRANIVRFVPEGEYDWNKMIQTTWCAADPAGKTYAMACIPVTGCIKVGAGNHTAVNGHQ